MLTGEHSISINSPVQPGDIRVRRLVSLGIGDLRSPDITAAYSLSPMYQYEYHTFDPEYVQGVEAPENVAPLLKLSDKRTGELSEDDDTVNVPGRVYIDRDEIEHTIRRVYDKISGQETRVESSLWTFDDVIRFYQSITRDQAKKYSRELDWLDNLMHARDNMLDIRDTLDALDLGEHYFPHYGDGKDLSFDDGDVYEAIASNFFGDDGVEGKMRVMREVHRVLEPAGRLTVVESKWSKPSFDIVHRVCDLGMFTLKAAKSEVVKGAAGDELTVVEHQGIYRQAGHGHAGAAIYFLTPVDKAAA
jgi:hypothetical protein